MAQEPEIRSRRDELLLAAVYAQREDELPCGDGTAYNVETGLQRFITWMEDSLSERLPQSSANTTSAPGPVLHGTLDDKADLAYEEFVKHESTELLRTAYLVVGNLHDAEALLQAGLA
jgi:hypothetical protein